MPFLFDQVDLGVTALEPEAGEAEVGALDLLEPEHLEVEPPGLLHVAHVQRDVVDADQVGAQRTGTVQMPWPRARERGQNVRR